MRVTTALEIKLFSRITQFLNLPSRRQGHVFATMAFHSNLPEFSSRNEIQVLFFFPTRCPGHYWHRREYVILYSENQEIPIFSSTPSSPDDDGLLKRRPGDGMLRDYPSRLYARSFVGVGKSRDKKKLLDISHAALQSTSGWLRRENSFEGKLSCM